MKWMKEAGYEHYEISNFSIPGKRSRHNTSYWSGKSYLGIGPSAHSFDGNSRQWNISNNNNYIRSIEEDVVPFEKEMLTPVQQLNEYIMTSLRTIEGLDLEKTEHFKLNEALSVRNILSYKSLKFIQRNLMVRENESLLLTNEGRLLADGIAAELFF